MRDHAITNNTTFDIWVIDVQKLKNVSIKFLSGINHWPKGSESDSKQKYLYNETIHGKPIWLDPHFLLIGSISLSTN